jgi:hypothetical protein
MPLFVDDPRHWQERAAEARRTAAQLPDPEAKRAMEEIARGYGRMAERAAARILERKGPGAG